MDTVASALNNAIQGLATAATRINADAVSVANAWTAAQNALAAPAPAPSSPAAATGLAGSTLGSTLADSTDVIGPMIDLLSARQAYGASLVAVRITADVEKTAIDGLGHLMIRA
jgi:hypothetical protein